MKSLKHQLQAINKLNKVKVGALFMEAGTGKTKPTIDLIKSVNCDYVCWFTPFQTIDNLNREINKWSFDCDILGIESIQNSDKLYLDIYNKLSKSKKGFIVVDESLKIKNIEAKRTKRIISLGRLVDYKLILNGTPISKNLLDIWSQFEFLDHSILNMSYAQFKNTFCEYKTLAISKGNRSRSKEWIIKYHNLDYLYQLIEPYVFECDLDLQVGKQYLNVNFELSEDEKNNHNKILNKILDDKWLMAKPNFFLELTQKLQNNYSRSNSKIHIVKDIIKSNVSSKVIIFAKYIETQILLKDTFPDVLILSYQKHSLGLNLQYYNRIIFFDKIWDYALLEQSERRIYRTGQKEDCIFYNLTGNVGLETMIDININNKQNLLKEFKKLSLQQFKNKMK